MLATVSINSVIQRGIKKHRLSRFNTSTNKVIYRATGSASKKGGYDTILASDLESNYN